ncbi:MAG: hypothetical protein AAF628_20540 [Planctomycetota bacterium]
MECANEEYGDRYDVMGSRHSSTWQPIGTRHMNPVTKVRLGWLQSADYTSLRGYTGTVDIPRTYLLLLRGIEDAPSIGPGLTSALEIPVSPTLTYWVFWRRLQPNANEGVTVTASLTGADTYLLDMQRAEETECDNPAVNSLSTSLEPMDTFALRASAEGPVLAELETVSVDPVNGVAAVNVTVKAPPATAGLSPLQLPVIDILQPAGRSIPAASLVYEVTAYDPNLPTPHVNGQGIQSLDLYVDFFGPTGWQTGAGPFLNVTAGASSYSVSVARSTLENHGLEDDNVSLRFRVVATLTSASGGLVRTYDYLHWIQ